MLAAGESESESLRTTKAAAAAAVNEKKSAAARTPYFFDVINCDRMLLALLMTSPPLELLMS